MTRARSAWIAYGLLCSAPALAVADSRQFDIPAQPLPAALKAFAAQAHIQLFYLYNVVSNARGNAIRGELDTRQALTELLRDTGLEAVYTSDTEVTIRHAAGGARTNAETTGPDARAIVGGGIGTAVPSSFGLIQPRTVGVSVARTF
jgi:hypothetical protein